MSGVSGAPGKDGTNGTDGVSPYITIEHLVGSPAGTRVSIIDVNHSSEDPLTFDVMNGRDGAGATYTFDNITLSGDGSQNSPYGVNTNYFATKTWVDQQGFLKNTDLTDYATKTYVDTASAAALSQSKSWVEQQKFVMSAYDFDANKQYVMTNTGWTSAIKIQVDTQVPTENDGILHIILES